MQIQSTLTRPRPLPHSSHFINNRTLWRYLVFVNKTVMKWSTETSVQWLVYVMGVERLDAVQQFVFGTSEGMRILNFMVTPYINNIQQYTLTQSTVHTPHRSQYAAISLTTSCTSSTYPLWTKCVILDKYWLWLPDDCFLVNRTLMKQFYLIQNI